MWWQVLVSVVAGLVLVYAVLLLLLWRIGRDRQDPTRFRDALRLVPDVLRLLHRLISDNTLPAGVRIRLILLLAYLASPIDLVPDFLPVIGYADDAIIVGIAIRSVIRRAGPTALDRHWPGTPEGLAVLYRLARLDPDDRAE